MNSSPKNNPSRRTVLKSIGATTALTASGLLPKANHAAPSAAANDKLRIGLIGAGNRAKWLTRALSRESHRADTLPGMNLKGGKGTMTEAGSPRRVLLPC